MIAVQDVAEAGQLFRPDCSTVSKFFGEVATWEEVRRPGARDFPCLGAQAWYDRLNQTYLDRRMIKSDEQERAWEQLTGERAATGRYRRG